MLQSTFTLRRAFWMVCAGILLLPRFAAANPALTIDLDGDGRRDQVVLEGREPSIVTVWLSASGSTQAIRTRVPILQIIAVDLDGDRRPELVARGSDSQLHVWTRKRNGFHAYRQRRSLSATGPQRDFRSIDDTDAE